MKPLYEPNPAIKKLAEVCDAIKYRRERAGRDHWSPEERRAFVAAAKACGTTFVSFDLPANAAPLPVRDDADARIRERDWQTREAQRTRTAQPAYSKPSLVYASDDDDGTPWTRG